MSGSEQPVLELPPDLTLRPWRASDAAAVVLAFTDADIQQWHVRVVTSEGEAREWLAQWPARWNAETDAGWAITTNATGKLRGYVALRLVNLEFGQAQVTYWTTKAFRGRGVATRAAREVARWALEDLGLHRLEVHHAAANPRSCRVALNAGFVLEGTMTSALLHADGWHDMHVHGRVQGDP